MKNLVYYNICSRHKYRFEYINSYTKVSKDMLRSCDIIRNYILLDIQRVYRFDNRASKLFVDYLCYGSYFDVIGDKKAPTYGSW